MAGVDQPRQKTELTKPENVRKMSRAFSGSGCHGGIFVSSWVAKLDDRLHGEPGGARYPDTICI